MKHRCSALAALAVLAVAPAFADELPQLTEDEWWQKEGFGFVGGYYTQYKVKDLGKPMQGGGLAVGGEYVSEDAHFGIGGAFTFSWAFQDYTRYKADDFLFGFDLHVPFRIDNSLTVYAGGGGTMHGFGLDFDEGYGWNNGRSGKQTGSGERWKNDGAAITEDAFVGFRWRFLDHAYLFGEYRREFGKIDLVCENYRWSNGSNLVGEFDLSGNRFLVGVGALF